MKIYVICPVRNITPEQYDEIVAYVNDLERQGHTVHFPPRDVKQDDPTGINICDVHAHKMYDADRVDIFWHVASSGSHFDLGMAFILKKKLNLVKSYVDDIPGKSYLKVIQQVIARQDVVGHVLNTLNGVLDNITKKFDGFDTMFKGWIK